MGLRRALTANLPLKLTSLALAIFLWFLAESEEPVSSLFEVDVAVRPPAGRTLVHPPGSLRALVVGPRRELLKLSASPLRLIRVLPDSIEGDEVRLELGPGEVELPRGIGAHVRDVQPRTLTVGLDSIVQRVVPVHPLVRLRADSGFALGGVSVMPGTVRLLGPRHRVAEVDSVRTEPLEIESDGMLLEREVALDTAGLGPGVRVHPGRVTVRVEVETMIERLLAGVAVRLSGAAAERLRPSLETVAVRVHGRAGRLASLEPDSVVVVADWAGGPLPIRVPLRVLLPHGLAGSAQPDSVDLLPRRPDG